MANDKDFLVNGPVVVGKDTKVTVGSTTSGSVASNDPSSWASYGDFSVASQDNTPTGVYIKPDGTKMYVVGSQNDTVFQYSLSTAWDVTTASYDSVSKSISAQETIPYDIFFKDDGTSMYIIGQSSDAISQYTLSTAWDVSTASYSQQKSVSAQGSEPRGLYFKSDGLRVFTADAATNSVFSYTLSTAWDISTASYDSKSLVTTSDGEDNPQGIVFNQDGTFLYVVGDGARAILQYQLTTAYDLSTATITSSSYAFNQNIGGIHIKPDNTKVYLVDYSQDVVTQITSTLKTEELDLSTGNYFNHTLTEYTKFPLSNAGDVQTFQLEVTGGVDSAYDISAGVYDSVSFSVASQDGAPWNFQWKSDGTKFYVIGLTNDTVYQYSCSIAYDISTASYDSVSFSVASQVTVPYDLHFKSDGTKMYISDNTTDSIYQYTLSTAWNLSTASYDSVSFSVASQDTTPVGLTFGSSGTKMYIGGNTNDTVYQYTLSTAWDLSTASYDSKSLSVSSQDGYPSGLHFKSDGLTLYMFGGGNNAVYQYSLTTAWDISTASYDSISFSFLSQDNQAYGGTFNADGTKMYMIGATSDAIHQYSTATDTTVTWPTSIEWAGGIAPAAPANGETDIFTFTTDDTGTSYTGVKSIDNAS